MLHKIIYKIAPSLPSTLNILLSYFFEAVRFTRLNTNNHYRRDQNKHRAILLRQCHGIEKAFSLPNMKEIFGIPQANVLFREVESYYNNYGLEREVLDGCKILHNYFLYHSMIEDESLLILKDKFNEFLKKSCIDIKSISGDCFHEFTKQNVITGVQFDDFFSSRSSVRNFTDKAISIDKLKRFGHLAGSSPSACNRQPWNLRIIQSKDQITKALNYQNGNKGFNDSISNLAIITGKISNFSSKERNQVFIDCGMFSMSFIMTLHANGIASCPLNMSNQYKDEMEIAKNLNFTKDEVPIMMIAFGYAAKNTKSSNSEKKAPCEFIQHNNL